MRHRFRPTRGPGSTNPAVYTASSACPTTGGCVVVGWYDDTSGGRVGPDRDAERERLDRDAGPPARQRRQRLGPGALARISGCGIVVTMPGHLLSDDDLLRGGRTVRGHGRVLPPRDRDPVERDLDRRRGSVALGHRDGRGTDEPPGCVSLLRQLLLRDLLRRCRPRTIPRAATPKGLVDTFSGTTWSALASTGPLERRRERDGPHRGLVHLVVLCGIGLLRGHLFGSAGLAVGADQRHVDGHAGARASRRRQRHRRGPVGRPPPGVMRGGGRLHRCRVLRDHRRLVPQGCSSPGAGACGQPPRPRCRRTPATPSHNSPRSRAPPRRPAPLSASTTTPPGGPSG